MNEDLIARLLDIARLNQWSDRIESADAIKAQDARIAELEVALRSVTRHLERHQELMTERGVDFILDTGPADMARAALEKQA